MAIDKTHVRDVVVVIPGIMGSELVDAADKPVWSASTGALVNAIRTLGRSLRQLQLPHGIGDNPAPDGIRATRLFRGLHVVPGLWSPITGYDGLLQFLRSDRLRLLESDKNASGRAPNLIPFPYDWRLSNRYNARRLAKIATSALERWQKETGIRDAKLVLICHSMGGLIARWFAERERGAEIIRTLITIGTPYRGALKAAKTLVNGLDVGIGPLSLSLTAFARSLPSLYQLLPQYDCLVGSRGRMDLITGDCPMLDRQMLHDANAFHKGIEVEHPSQYAIHKAVGINQPTLTTAHINGNALACLNDIDGLSQGGDGTVPRLAAEPIIGRGQEVHEIANQHGVLHETRSLIDLVDGILSREEIIWQSSADPNSVGIELDDLWSTKQDVELHVIGMKDRRFRVTIKDELDRTVVPQAPIPADGRARFGILPEGAYQAIVVSASPGGPPPVSKPFIVLDPDGNV